MLVLAGPAEFPLGVLPELIQPRKCSGFFPILQGAVSGVKGFKTEQCKKMSLSNQRVRTWRIMRLESDTWHGFVKGK